MSIAESPRTPPKFFDTALGDPTPRRWTRDEYYRMGDEGFFQGQRVQLIYGEIVKASPMKSPHATSVQLARDAVSTAYGQLFCVRSQLPLYISDESEPDPDLAVVLGSPRDHVDEHPRTALLVVEVSETTLRFDRTVKRQLYASAEISEYWIVNLIDRRLEIFRSAKEGDYTHTETLSSIDRITPPGAQQSILVADLLP